MYSVQPLKTGKFQLGPFSFKYKGDEYTSNMVFLEAVEEKVVARSPLQAPDTAERLDPARHPLRAFDKELRPDPWLGDAYRGGR